ncbi:hypothetical protein BJX62DRAFT_247068 [Aspergillus germanicus]
MIDPAALRRQYDEICRAENSKDEIITNVFEYIKDLELRLENEKDEVDAQKRATTSYRDDSRRYLAERDVLFLEQFLQDGKNGGDDAARALIHAPSYNIRVFANVLGLTKLYRETNLLRPGEDLSNFTRGFNMESPLCDFIDAVMGRRLFAEDFNNTHCQRIFFWASADSGYAPILGPHRGSQMISLVEWPAFPREMAELVATFAITSFSHVFMPTKLERPARVISPPTQHNSSPAIAAATTPALITAPGLVPNYASAAKTAPATSVVAITPAKRAHTPKNKGQTATSSKKALAVIKRRKFCNQYHLQGYCHNTATYGSCAHEHGPELSGQELNDLMWIARSTPCYNGLSCRDLDCISGHRCAYGDYCMHKECKFHKDLHAVDTVIVRTLEL